MSQSREPTATGASLEPWILDGGLTLQRAMDGGPAGQIIIRRTAAHHPWTWPSIISRIAALLARPRGRSDEHGACWSHCQSSGRIGGDGVQRGRSIQSLSPLRLASSIPPKVGQQPWSTHLVLVGTADGRKCWSTMWMREARRSLEHCA
jgi:hypothetical protein